jgi:hypothetical protein
VACTVCHHNWDGSGKIQACGSSGCHDVVDSKIGHDSYYQAFHSKHSEYSCVHCHQNLANEGMGNLSPAPCANNACHGAE